MSEEKSTRLTDSPRKITHLQVTRKLSRGGGDSVDADEYASEYYNFQDRRGSSQSITRYNSCPQLAEGDSEHTESYERTVDDINTNTSALNRDMHCVIIQGPSPLFNRKGLRENGQVSDTPTPPSTPKSRRSVVSSRDSLLSSPDKLCVTSPIASPRLLLRKQLIRSALSRDSSVDSLKDQSPVDNQKKIPLSVENLSKFDEIKTGDEPINTIVGQTVRIGSVRSRKMSQTIEASESLSKCENWLQTLNIAQTDKVKSRSHIQLPPI
ncbi:uncharacterized protein LOC127857510 isoform X2 [Dreissena polymorpha]|nr:uncharacterized protein LOC127857510 isoform X2 [Dreissena polymorpha]